MNGVILRINGNNDLGQALRLDGNVTFLKALDHPHRREFGRWFDAMAKLLQDKVEAEPEMKPTEVFCPTSSDRVTREGQEKPVKTIVVQSTETTEAYVELFDDRDSAILASAPRGRNKLFKT